MAPLWGDPAWLARAQAVALEALAAAGRPARSEPRVLKAWGRSYIQTLETTSGLVWIKYGYGLPPGEERVLEQLAKRWPDRVPRVVATWPGAVAMEPLPGRELEASDPVEAWVHAARALAELEAGEVEHLESWRALGLRERAPADFAAAVEALRAGPVVSALEVELLARIDAFLPEWCARYAAAWCAPVSLVHQDSGCCNIHLTEAGPVFYDWADVVLGSPVFSCDRLLDQVPAAQREAVIGAFLEPLGLARDDFDGLRRSNVLHEVLRYHDELEHLDPRDEVHGNLSRAVCSQLRVLVEHESSRS